MTPMSTTNAAMPLSSDSFSEIQRPSSAIDVMRPVSAIDVEAREAVQLIIMASAPPYNSRVGAMSPRHRHYRRFGLYWERAWNLLSPVTMNEHFARYHRPMLQPGLNQIPVLCSLGPERIACITRF
jgi:hypothetical protein